MTQFRQKRERLRAAGGHLVEIDLIRRGERSVHMPTFVDTSAIDTVPYLVTLTRAGATAIDVWPIPLANTLPVIVVPLYPPDTDVPLDLMQALTTVYAEAAYQLLPCFSVSPMPFWSLVGHCCCLARSDGGCGAPCLEANGKHHRQRDSVLAQ